jgi:glycopeptide antibiotics resistance protein
MNWRKIGQICAISYLFLYLAAMVMPRKPPYEQFSSDHANFIKRAFHQILYYGGPLEPVANFFVLIPVFVITLTLLGKSRIVLALAICISLSAAAESLQQLIPGRVSSLRDFALNSAGAIAAFLLYKFFGSRKLNL